MEIIEALIKTLPAVGRLIKSLIELGKSPDEAADLVIEDIESRRAEYEREKAEDEAALAEKHGQ